MIQNAECAKYKSLLKEGDIIFVYFVFSVMRIKLNFPFGEQQQKRRRNVIFD